MLGVVIDWEKWSWTAPFLIKTLKSILQVKAKKKKDPLIDEYEKLVSLLTW